MAEFYGLWGLNGIIQLCLIWTTALIPLTYLLTCELSKSKYAGILSSFLVAFSPLVIYQIAPAMPYQTFFIPTLSCLFILLILFNEKRGNIYLGIISGIIFIFGIQFHLSFLLLTPFYIYHVTKLYKKFSSFKKILIIISNLVFSLILFKLNIILPISLNLVPTHINLSHIIPNSISYTIQDLNSLLPIKLGFIPFIILITIPIFTKKSVIIKLLPILILYPLVGIFTYSNWYTAAYWPIFFALISISLMIFKNNLYLFIFYLVITILSSTNQFIYLRLPLKQLSYYVKINVQQRTEKIDKYLLPSKKNIVFHYDNIWLNTFMGYYYYKEISNNKIMVQQNESYEEQLRLLDDNSVNKIVYCTSNCPKFEQKYQQYKIDTLEIDNTSTIYRISKKTMP